MNKQSLKGLILINGHKQCILISVYTMAYLVIIAVPKSRKKLAENWNASYASKFQRERLKFSPAWNITSCVLIATNIHWSYVQFASNASERLRQRETVWQKK
jgi:hypothetical protein